MDKEQENLDKANMVRVITALEQEKPITKKVACEILNITYNTPRLKKLIDEFKIREEGIKKQRARLRGTPLTTDELKSIAESYLNEEPISSISDMLYRPVALIKKAVKELNIPIREVDASYQNPCLIEDYAISENYEKGDLVYAARYQRAALIERKHKSTESTEGPVYTIYLLGKDQCYATQPYWELADLTRLQKELDIKLVPIEGMLPSYNPR